MKCPNCKADLLEEGIIEVETGIVRFERYFFNENYMEFEYDECEEDNAQFGGWLCPNCKHELELPSSYIHDPELIKFFIKDHPELMKKFVKKYLNKVAN